MEAPPLRIHAKSLSRLMDQLYAQVIAAKTEQTALQRDNNETYNRCNAPNDVDRLRQGAVYRNS